MKSFKTVAALVAAICIANSFSGFGQTTETEPVHRTIGLSANVQNTEFGITVPIFLTQRFVLAPAIGLRYAENVGTDIALALVPKFYYSTKQFAPYSTLRVGALLNRPANSEQKGTTDLLAGIGTGAEYFLIPNFSFGVEGQVNLTFSDENSTRFGNANSMNANLATVVTANIYFTR